MMTIFLKTRKCLAGAALKEYGLRVVPVPSTTRAICLENHIASKTPMPDRDVLVAEAAGDEVRERRPQGRELEFAGGGVFGLRGGEARSFTMNGTGVEWANTLAVTLSDFVRETSEVISARSVRHGPALTARPIASCRPWRPHAVSVEGSQHRG